MLRRTVDLVRAGGSPSALLEYYKSQRGLAVCLRQLSGSRFELNRNGRVRVMFVFRYCYRRRDDGVDLGRNRIQDSRHLATNACAETCSNFEIAVKNYILADKIGFWFKDFSRRESPF